MDVWVYGCMYGCIDVDNKFSEYWDPGSSRGLWELQAADCSTTITTQYQLSTARTRTKTTRITGRQESQELYADNDNDYMRS